MDTQHDPKSGQSVTERIKGYLRNHPWLWVVLYLGCFSMVIPIAVVFMFLVEHFDQWAIENPLKVMALFLPFGALVLVSLIYLRYLIWPKTLGGQFALNSLEEHAKRHNVPDIDMKKFLRVYARSS